MEQLIQTVKDTPPLRVRGKVTNIIGLIIEGYCPEASVGSMCDIVPLRGGCSVSAEVVGFRDSRALLMPLGELRGLGPGSLIRVRHSRAGIRVGEGMLGRVFDALGNPIDGMASPCLSREMPLYALPPGPMEREQITSPMDLGIRSINATLTTGMGQRMAIMAGSGVGKSTLLGMMARDTQADVNVIALIGERGREVREFIEQDLGSEGLKRSVLIVATSDQSPLLRMRGVFAATSIAEYFCNQGKNVLMLMDSVTRYAMAMREIGLAVGEPPTSKGFPPSVFAQMPKFLERAGNYKGKGSITGLYTVLVEGDDMNEPVTDTVRSILDGHIVLSRQLASKNHYPPIDVLQSSSRLMNDLVEEEHQRWSGRLKDVLATYQESEDLINIGAYSSGSNKRIDDALKHIDPVNAFLRQSKEEKVPLDQAVREMKAVFQPDGG
ncbi:MAG: FliI/YscN family ATPase [Desulfohalobiaceae bacterium]|nr:FliI/YscN family ATPase [Desulfohalobiaceae bacterium]